MPMQGLGRQTEQGTCEGSRELWSGERGLVRVEPTASSSPSTFTRISKYNL